MVKYEYYEELEEQAFRDVIEPKKKPKKQKKSWKDVNKKETDRDKKNSWNNSPNRN